MSHRQLEFNFGENGDTDPTLFPEAHVSPYAELLRQVDHHDIRNLIVPEWGESMAAELTGWSRADSRGTSHQMEARDILFLATRRAARNTDVNESTVAKQVYARIINRLDSRRSHDMQILGELTRFRDDYDDDGSFYVDTAREFCEEMQNPNNQLSQTWDVLGKLLENSGLSEDEQAEMLLAAQATIEQASDPRAITDVFELIDEILTARFHNWRTRISSTEQAMQEWNQTHPASPEEQ